MSNRKIDGPDLLIMAGILCIAIGLAMMAFAPDKGRCQCSQVPAETQEQKIERYKQFDQPSQMDLLFVDPITIIRKS